MAIKVRNLVVGDYIRYRGRNHTWRVINTQNGTVQIQRWKAGEGLIGNDTRWLLDLDQDIETVTTGE